MGEPEHLLEIFLYPGDFYFGEQNTRIRTVLGSCVAITMWHPYRRIGGMCHYLLPSRPNKMSDGSNGHYAEDAMQMFLQEIRTAKTITSEYRVKLFGGANMFPQNMHAQEISKPRLVTGKSEFPGLNVSSINILKARALVEQFGFKLEAEDMGGEEHRHLVFDIWSGNAWVRKPNVHV